MNIQDMLVLERCLLSQALEKNLESHGDFVAVIEDCVRQRRSVDGKEEHVNDDISSTEERWRVVFITLLVKHALVVHGTRDVVQFAHVIVHSVCIYWQVASVVNVAVPKGEDNPERGEGTDEAVESTEERDHEGVGRVPEQDIPIPCRKGVHSQAVVDASNDIEIAMMG